MPLAEVEAIYQTATDRAVCVHRDEKDREDIWLPLAAIDLTGSFRRGQVVTISASERLLIDKGLL